MLFVVKKLSIIFAVGCLCALGCKDQGNVKTSDLAAKEQEPVASSGIAPAGPNVGGITPVAGAESVGGAGGGGVGQAAKDMARSRASGAAAVAGGSSAMGALTGEGE